eukprot:403340232
MDDLKNLVIQSLEDEGTLSALRAQLRARVYKAIEKHADPMASQAKSAAAAAYQKSQLQNPGAKQIHEDEDSLVIAILIREYLEYYRMEYSLSVYQPETALSHVEQPHRDDICHKTGIKAPNQQETSAPLLVHLLKQLRSKEAENSHKNDQQKEKVQVLSQENNSNKQFTNQKAVVASNNPFNNDDIEEDIVEEIVDDKAGNQHNFYNREDMEGVGASASMSLGIDQSIDTLRMDEYDYLSSAAQSQRSFKKDAKVINSQQLEEDQEQDDMLIGQDDDMSEDEGQKMDKNKLNINKEQKLMKKFSSVTSTGKKQKNEKNKRKHDFSMYSEDIAELLEAFHENSQQIQSLYPLLRVNQVFNFKNDIDDIVGFELDELVYYITRVHHLSLTKWKYTWQEVLELVLPAFAKYGTQMRRLGRDNWYITGKEKEEGKSNSLNQSDNGTTFDEEEDSIKLVKNKEGGYDIINITDLQQQNQQQALNTTIDQDELLKVRQKGQEIFQMKIDKHFDKIKEIFMQSCSSSGGAKKNQSQKDQVQQNTQNVVDEGQSLKEKQRMKLIKLKRFMDDIAYICGLVFIDKERYLENGQGNKQQEE